jgi:hypothetical protein
MNNRLEQFVRDHREEFDTEEPDNKIWEEISREMNPDKKKQTPVVHIPIRWIKWSAAAVILLIAAALWFFRAGRSAQQPGIVQTNPNNLPNTNNPGGTNQADTSVKNSPNLARTQSSPKDTNAVSNNPTLASIRPGDNKSDTKNSPELELSVNEEMFHYAKLVEIKHKELKAIEKDEPLLYKQFSLDVKKLDSVYRSLQEQLPTNPNREQLLEAMLQNLQLQMELLNHQLEIIKQINHSKKSEYEKAYKTV